MGAAGTASEGRKGPRHALGGSAARDMAKTLLRAWPSPLIWDPQHPPGTPGDPPETLGDHRVRHGGGFAEPLSQSASILYIFVFQRCLCRAQGETAVPASVS